VAACLNHMVPEGVQGGVPDRGSCSLGEGRFRPNKGVRTVAGASWSGESGRRSTVVVGRRSPGVVWSRHVVVCGRRGPSQRTPAAVKHFAMRIISTNPPFCVSSYEATCILSVVSTCIPDGGTCMSSFAKVRSGERGGGGFIRIQGYYRGTQGACG
jgi:hypothetical protein